MTFPKVFMQLTAHSGETDGNWNDDFNKGALLTPECGRQ
jgi:hypothetical protein